MRSRHATENKHQEHLQKRFLCKNVNRVAINSDSYYFIFPNFSQYFNNNFHKVSWKLNNYKETETVFNEGIVLLINLL